MNIQSMKMKKQKNQGYIEQAVGVFIWDNGEKARKVEEANRYGLMDPIMKATGKITKLMDMED